MNTQQRAAMQMALEALLDNDTNTAFTSLREELRNASEVRSTDTGEPVAKVIRNEAGQIAMQKPDGSYFDMSKHIGQTFYTEPTSLEQILHDPENQPSQYGTVPMDYPEKAARQMRDAAVKLVDDTPFTNWFRGDLKQAIADLPIPTVEPLVVPQGEPVAWAYMDADGSFMDALNHQHGAYQTPLYTTPPSVEVETIDGHSKHWWQHEVNNARAEGYERGFAAGKETTKEKATKVCEEIVIENGGKTARNKTSFECAADIRSMK